MDRVDEQPRDPRRAPYAVCAPAYIYVALAMYDATVAAWDSKYAYNRPRPSELDPTLKTRLPTPRSPSYPSEHAATAAAAAAVLAYFFPAEAASSRAWRNRPANRNSTPGLQFPERLHCRIGFGQAGGRPRDRGRQSGWLRRGLDRHRSDRQVHVDRGQSGQRDGHQLEAISAGSPNEFRPPVPPACDSATMVAEVADVRNFPRSPAAFATNQRAMYWQSPEGLNIWPYVYANKWMFEDKLDQNAPRVGACVCLDRVAFFDAFIASQDGKFAYWYIRPPQLEPAIVPLFPVPNFPSYPSNHSTFSATRSEMLAYLFPPCGRNPGDWSGRRRFPHLGRNPLSDR